MALFPKIHAIGDSITQGIDATSGQSNGYRLPLFTTLTGAGKLPVYSGNLAHGAALPAYAQWHSGYGGQNCSQIRALWSEAHGAVRSAYIYLLQAGTNDVRTDLGPNPNVNQDWDALFDVVLAQADRVSLVVAAVPTPLAVTSDDARVVLLGQHIASQVALRFSQGHFCISVDMHAALNNTTDLSDGIHPNDGGGYPKMAAVWYAAISRYL
jgi:hypothetical protein